MENSAASPEHEADKSAFGDKVLECLNDRRVAGYFRRGLVQQEDVVQALVDGPAFEQALKTKRYQRFSYSRTEMQGLIECNKAVFDEGVLNGRTASIVLCSALLGALSLAQLALNGVITCTISIASAISALFATALFVKARSSIGRRFRRIALAAFFALIAVCPMVSLHILIHLDWALPIFLPLLTLACIVCYLLTSSRETVDQCLYLLEVAWKDRSFFSKKRNVAWEQERWLSKCIDSIIMPQVVLAINTTLGKDKDRLLVEEDSEGLRKLQDPTFTVETRSERRIANLLSQMDGGSIALAGPRGAGKSTLLRKFSGPLRDAAGFGKCVSVYVTAPAEYLPRDFIAELLQRLCETYLQLWNYPMPEPIFREHRPNIKRLLGYALGIIRLTFRAAIACAIIAWMAWPVIGHLVKMHYPYHHYYVSILNYSQHEFDHAYAKLYNSIHKSFNPLWSFLAVFMRIVVILIALVFLSSSLRMWKACIGLRSESALAKRARDHLLRLQVEKTVTWGRSLSSPTGRIVGLSINRGGSASYTPWTLPELVRHTRLFMQDISEEMKGSSYPIVIGIDEIDRIGSLDHAERFIAEIKAIFGVERCFFLVAVAEDVGSVFAQRATAGRSILENAFDDIVAVEMLDLAETRDLLLKRVPGFTDSFVYLVHALSGGLPRELIRVTRRLVEVNQDLHESGRNPRLEDLSFALVKEALLEAIRATRSQLARLTLGLDWVVVFERLRQAKTSLSHSSSFFDPDSYRTIRELSQLGIPKDSLEKGRDKPSFDGDEQAARQIIQDFIAFSLFGLTIIDAFSDGCFDLEIVRTKPIGSEGSYEELAAARVELTISPHHSMIMLDRFRDSMHSS